MELYANKPVKTLSEQNIFTIQSAKRAHRSKLMALKKYWLLLIIANCFFLFGAVTVLSMSSLYAGDQTLSSAGMKAQKLINNDDFGGRFTLVRQDGRLVNSSMYQGQYKLVYFGFTYCSEVCPLVLKKMAVVINALDKKQVKRILPVFISVDPERDTPDVVRSYVSLFDPRFVGFTGNPEQVDKVLARYRVFARKAQDAGATEYRMDHTSFIYLTGTDDQVISVFMTTSKPRDITKAIADALG